MKITTLGKAYETETFGNKKSDPVFSKSVILLVLIIAPLFCCLKEIKRLEQQLADEKERATFYRECLLSDELSDPCRSWIMLERFGVTIGETYTQAD